MENIKQVVAKNLTKLRKQNKLTQMELAEKINYSDKAVSRWESGEVTPDVEVLNELCKIYNVPITILFEENLDVVKAHKDSKKKTNNKIIITLLAMSLVWILATIIFVYYKLLFEEHLWQVFICGLPITCIIALVFNCIWGRRIWTLVLVSCVVWSTILTFYILFLQYNIWPVFVLGAPLQVATILWGGLRPKQRKQKNRDE